VSDINSNIRIDFDTGSALAQLRSLQAGLSKFHQTLAEGNLAAANAQKGLTSSLIQSINATGKFVASQKTVSTSTASFTNALEKNQLSMKEYFRYSAAAATANTKVLTRAFEAEREILNRARRDRVKALQSQYVQLNKANGALVKTLQVLPSSLEMTNGKFTELGTRIQMAAQRQQFLNQLLKQGSTQLLNFGKNMQWAGRQLMVGLTIPLSMLAGYAAKAFRELEQETVAFRRVYGDMLTSDAETERAIQNIQSIATEYTKFGIAVKDTMSMAAKAAAAGFTGSALDTQVRQANKLSVLGQIDQQKALETTISLQNAFGLSSEELAKKIDFLNAVENQTVVSLDDITTAIPKVAPVIKQLGGSVEDLAFFLTAMEEGGINASEGANALKSGLASLINPTKQTTAMLKDMGININSIVEGNAGDLKGTVVGFANALDTLAPLQRARAIEQMFGKFQFARLSTLFQNVTKDGSQASRALKLAGASVEELAILSERELAKVEDAVGVKFQASIEKLKQSLMPIGKEFLKAATPIIEFFGNMFDKFNNLGDGTKKVVLIITAALGLIGPAALMTFGLLANGVANVIKFFTLLRGGIAKLNGQTNVLGAGFDYLTQNEIENLAQSNALHTSHQKLISVFNVEKGSLDSLAASYANAATQARSLATSSPGLFAAPGARSAVSKLPQSKKYAEGVLSVPGPKGAGDIQPAMLSPGESVIPTKQSQKHRGLIKAIMSDKVPGYMAGRIGAKKGPQSSREPLFLGMPKTFKETSIKIANQKMLDDIDRSIRNSSLKTLKPADLGKLVAPTTGHSFPVKGVGGIYQKDGKQVFVKPVTDLDAARAEEISTTITPAHDLVAPKQQIKVIMDPTDVKGKRKLAVLVSPYDPKFANPDGKFTKQQMADQLYASSLRGDKDLQTANVSGNMVIDAGTSYAYGAASGPRTQTTSLKSVLEQARINTMGVPGSNARRAFADSIKPIAEKMTAEEFHTLMTGTVTAHNSRLASTLATTKLTPDEKKFYAQNILSRGKEAEDIDWREIHSNLVNLEPAKKKQLTAAAIEKKFQEQQLKKRQSGHANQNFYNENFYAEGFIKGRLGEKANQAADLPKYVTDIERFMDEEINKPGVSKDSKLAWQGKKRTFLDNFANQIVVTPEGLYDTGQGGKPASEAQLRQSMKYIFGLAPNKDGAMVTGSFARWDKLKQKLTIGGASKGSGGLRVGNPEAYEEYKKVIADREERNKRAGKGQETTNLVKLMKERYPNLSVKQLERLTQTEAVHVNPGISQSGKSIARSAEKWATGQAFPDLGAVNQYLLNKTKTQKLLDWNKKDGTNPLKLSAADEIQYKKAADFMATGRHPTNIEEAKLVRSAAELELKAHTLMEESTRNGGKAPRGLPSVGIKPNKKYTADAAYFVLNSRLGDDSTFYTDLEKYKEVVNLETKKRTGKISVGKGEGIIPVDKIKPGKKLKPKKVTGQNSTPRPSRSTVKGGPDGERIPKQTGLVASKKAMQFIGKQDGDITFGQSGDVLSKNAQGRITHQLQEQERLLKLRNKFSQQEIDQALSQHKKRLIVAEQEKANQYAQTQRDRQLAKIEGERLTQSKSLALAARKEKVSKFSGKAAGTLGGVAMGAAMTGMDPKVTGGLFAASTVAGLLPALMNPWVAAATAMAAVGVLAWKFKKDLENATKEGINLGKSMSMTSKKLQDLSVVTGTVSASETANRKRQNTATGTTAVSRKFGMTTLGSDFGKGLLSDISKQAETGAGPEQIAKSISTSLAVAITQGVISVDQAKSISSALGEKLKSYEIPALISGNLVSLLGPNGENLAKDPLGIRLKIQSDSMTQQADAFRNAIELAQPTIKTGGMATVGAYAAGGSLAGAGVGAGFGGIGAIPGYAIGAVTGAVIGGGVALAQESRNNAAKEENNKLMGAAIQLGIEQITLQQGLVDSLNAEYDTKLKTAKTAKEIKTIEANRKKDLDALNLKNKENLAILIKQKDSLDPKVFSDAIKAQTDTMYKEGPMKVFADQANKALAGMKETDFKTTLQLEYASGNLDPITLTSLIKYASTDKKLEQKYNLLVTQKGGAEANLALQLLAKAGARPETITSMMELLTKNPKDFKKNMDAINILGNMQQQYGVTVDIDTNGEQKIAQVKSIINSLKNDKTEITKDIIAKYAKDPKNPNQSQFQGILDNWQTLVGSAKTITKTMAINFVTASTDNDVLKAYMVATGITPLKGRGFADQKKRLMPKAQAWLTGIGAGSQGAPVKNFNTPDVTTKDRDTTLDSLLTRLKFISDAAIKATGGVDELIRITSGDGLTKFAGITQQLLGVLGGGQNGGFNREFITYLEGMDDATRGVYLNTQKLKKGIVELTPKGEALNEALNEKSIREYSVAQYEASQNVKAQRAALIKLTLAGVDNATALSMVANAADAVAINGSTIDSAKLQQMAKDAKLAKDEMEDLNLELKIAAQASRDDLVELSKTLATLQAVKSKYPSLTADQLNALSQNPAMIKGFAKLFSGAGTKDELAKLKTDLEDWINGIDAAIKIKINIEAEADPIQFMTNEFANTSEKFGKYIELARRQLEASFRDKLATASNAVDPYYTNKDGVKSAGFVAREAQERMDAVQASIDAENRRYERQTQDIEAEYAARLNSFESLLIGQQNKLDEANAAMEKAQKEISDMQDAARLKYDSYYSGVDKDGNGIINIRSTESLQRQIDDRNEIIKNTIDKPIEVAQEFIDQAERRIELNFTRPIAALEETSAKYADDLTLIDRAAEEINKKYDAQEEALNKVSAINDQIIGQQKEQLDLAGAISSGDIGAAAKAMQQIQASRVSQMAKTQQQSISAAREGQINALTGSTSGLTRAQIEEEQYKISRKIYNLQQDQSKEDKIIFDLKETIYKKEEERKTQLGLLNALESTMTSVVKERQVALDAIAVKELAMKPLVDAVATAQTAVNVTQAAYNKLLAEKDAALKAAELTHIANLTKYQAELRSAEDNLTKANAELAKAEKALADLQAEIAKQQAEIDKQAQTYVDLETNILAADLAASTLTKTLALATEQAIKLAAALKTKADADIAATAAAKAKAEADAKIKADADAKTKADADAKTKADADAKAIKDAAEAAAAAAIAATNAATSAATSAVATKTAEDAALAALAAQNATSDDPGVTRAALQALQKAEALAIKTAAAAATAAAVAKADAAEAMKAQKAKDEAEARAAEAIKIAAEAAAAQAAADAKDLTSGGYYFTGTSYYKAAGGLIPKHFASGGYARGTDTVPAMLTPGEFVMSKYAVNTHGVDKLKAINNGDSVGDSVYNYSVSVNVKSDSNPDEIARAVMMQIKQVDGQKIRGNRN